MTPTRVRPGCRRSERRDPAPQTPLEQQRAGEPINRAVLSGVIAADPQRDRSREGEPVTVLLVAFPAPDERAHGGTACCEVEAPDELADPQRDRLRAGATVLVTGEMTGAGGLWATYLSTKRP